MFCAGSRLTNNRIGEQKHITYNKETVKFPNQFTLSTMIATHNFRTFWTDEKKCNRYHFSCRDLCRAIDFLIDNIFVRFGGKVFRQVIGISMGTNSAPLLADLFLHTYEYEFIIKTMKGDIISSIKRSDTSTIFCVSTTATSTNTSTRSTHRN